VKKSHQERAGGCQKQGYAQQDCFQERAIFKRVGAGEDAVLEKRNKIQGHGISTNLTTGRGPMKTLGSKRVRRFVKRRKTPATALARRVRVNVKVFYHRGGDRPRWKMDIL